VKLLVAAVVGVPLITPVLLFMLKPAGNVPTLMLHVNGALPPLAVKPLLYAAPIVPSNGVPLSDGTAYVMMDFAASIDWPLESTTRTVKLLVAAVVGVPLITPVLLFMLSPDGNAPSLILHVNAEWPPLSDSPML